MRTALRRLLSTLGAAALVTTFVTASPGASAEAADAAYPTLNGITMTKSTVTAGSSITAAVDASDDVGITSVSIRFVNTENYLQTISVTRPWRSDGLLSVSTSAELANGPYSLRAVTLSDASGKKAEYLSAGRKLTLTPAVPDGPTTHSLDLAATAFAVTGGADLTAPRVTSVALPIKPSTAGSTGRLEFTVDDAGPVTASIVWASFAADSEYTFGPQTATGGRINVPFTLGLPGTHRLAYIIVTDERGNRRQYDSAGRATSVGWSGTHTLDFSRFDFSQKPAAPTPIVTPHPASVRVHLHATAEEAKALTGWRVVVNPGNIVRDVPISEGATQIDIKGLVNGTTYSASTIGRSTAGDSAATTLSVRPMQSTNVFAVTDATGGDLNVDVVARQPRTTTTEGQTYIYPTNGKGAWGSRVTGFGAEERNCARVAPGDIYDLYRSEVLCYGNALTALSRDGSGTVIGTAGWSSMRFVDGGQDLTGDGWPDIVGVTSDGVLKIYQTGSASRIVSTTTLGSGWNAFTALLQVGDFSGDRKADLVAVDTAGRLWMYPGNGRGGFGARVGIGSGWGGFGAVLPLRDFNGDGRADIGAITTDGKLLLYPGNGRNGFLTAKTIGTGWGVYL
ncbi:putative secreted protein [Janibacter sp. HTCC2649]|uniref:FG-GAP repeat domain-containing protein n=1 Tax=Janibacter sp. HTCC2649 TaxID=313589 RepID=UPI0000670CB5|nr:VCBS repeat-containing protein [Janibacter sp. HTCC2649]EAQ00415.1 putative secreted protein [Janibacter sp. HTCC2649]